MVRRRRILLVLVSMCVAIFALGAIGYPLALRRTKASIERRCARAVHGTCVVAQLTTSRAGAHCSGITATGINGGVSLTVQNLQADFSWWDALVGKQPLDVTVAIDGLNVQDTAVLADVVREVRSWRDESATNDGERSRSSRIKLQRLTLQHASATANISSFANASLTNGSVEWQRESTLQIRWENVEMSLGPINAFRSGQCSVELPQDGSQGRIECENFRSVVNTEDLEERTQSVMGLIELLRALASGARPSAVLNATGTHLDATSVREQVHGSRSSLIVIPRSWAVVTRGGTVILRRGESEIANLTPASFTVNIDDGHVREARARLGDPNAGPALDVTVNRPGISSISGASTAGSGAGSVRGSVPRWSINAQGEALPLREVARWIHGVPWHDVEQGRVRLSAQITPVEGQSGAIEATGECALENFGLSHPKLSHDPVVGLSVSLRGTALIDRAHRRVQTNGLTVTVNHVQGVVSGWAEKSQDHVALDVNLRLDRSSCDGIRSSLPPSLTGPVAELSLGGDIAAAVHVAVDTRQLETTQFDVRLDDRCYVSARDTFTRGAQRFAGPFVQRVQEPTGMRAFVTGPGTAVWVPIGSISQYVIDGVLSREDGRFYRHAGVDPFEIRHAIIRNLTAGRFVYGASTISMQLAKNVFLAREKTLVRKLQEFVLTWYLERTLGKDAILELYLNVVEFGPGVYGIGPASRFYFDREPSELTPLQSIFLATLLPSPVQRSAPFFRGSAGPGTMNLLRGHARIMNMRGLLTAEELASANTEVLTFRARRAPVGGALTLEVLPTLEDQAAVTEALARVVPTRVRPLGQAETQEQVAAANTSPEGSGDEPREEDAPSNDEPVMNDTVGHARGYQRATVRIGAMP